MRFFAMKPDPKDAARLAAEADGLVSAYLLDGKGGGRELTWTEVRGWSPEQGTLWVHLNRTRKSAFDYLSQESGLSATAVESLLAEDTRPRVVREGHGLLINLRGINFNPGADPEDMISLRCWAEPKRLISTRARRLMSINDLRAEIEAGRAPVDEMDCLFRLGRILLDKVGVVIGELEDGIDALEDEVISGETKNAREQLTRLRRRAVTMRRHLAPQRDAFMRLEMETHALLDEKDSVQFRELADMTTRFVEDIDSIRERAVVIQDEIISRLTERQGRHSYTLSVVAAIMLPLSFITSLFGVSMVSVPLTQDADGFTNLLIGLGALTLVQIVVFRLMRWL